MALFVAWQGRSVSPMAFGSDNLVELLSAAMVLLEFTPRFRVSQLRAARFCGSLLCGLAGVVSVIALAGLLRRVEADTSKLGSAITGGALLPMSLLAQKKRTAAEQTGNKALRADAVQSATCAYLAALTLAGMFLRPAFCLTLWFTKNVVAAVHGLVWSASVLEDITRTSTARNRPDCDDEVFSLSGAAI